MNGEIADWLVGLTQAYRSWGFGLCFLYLRNVKGFAWNHKRVYRIYRELELTKGFISRASHDRMRAHEIDSRQRRTQADQ